MSSSLRVYPLPTHIQDTFSYMGKQFIKNHNGYFCTHVEQETNLPKFKVVAFFEKIGKREFNQAKDKYLKIQEINNTIKKVQTIISF